jgi:hypothetical protein
MVSRSFVRLALPAFVVGTLGCSTPASTGPELPAFDPQAAVAQAMNSYDADKDGSLSKQEVDRSPGLTAAFPHFDKDGSGTISPEEMLNRLKYYADAGIALYGWTCEVRQGGRPLPGATVTLVPEDFMKSVAQPATGVTDNHGVASPVIKKDELDGAYFGLYRIVVSKKDASGRELVPAEFNSQTKLGQELAPDNRSAETRRPIEISSR